MAVTAEDLLYPTGKLNASTIWPDLTATAVTAILEAILETAANEVPDFADPDDADAWTRLWVERRVKQDVLDGLVMSVSSATFVDEGSGSITSAQMDALERQIADLTTQLTALEEAETDEDEGEYAIQTSLR